jgi:hypothetical protein
MAKNAIMKFTGGGLQPYRNPDDAETQPVVLAGGITLAQGTVLGLVAGSGVDVNEVQTVTITGTPTGGFVNLVFNGQVTANIAYNAIASAVQSALEALSNIGTGNVACAGGPLPGTPVTVAFQGALAGRKVPVMTTFAAFTGGASPAVAVAETTPGKPANGYWDAYNDAAVITDLRVARGFLKESVTTSEDGLIISISGEFGTGAKTATCYTSGDFLGSELVGLDAAGLTDLGGKVIAGNPAALNGATTVIHIP